MSTADATSLDRDSRQSMRRSMFEPSLLRDSLTNLPPAPKRRAFSISDRASYTGATASASAARRAVSSAFSNVTRFVRSASSGDQDAVSRASTLIEDPTEAPPPRSRGRSYSATVSSWNISKKLPQVPASLKALRRPRQLSLRRRSSSEAALEPWHEGHVQYVSSTFALHGEDAEAISSYYHIVADGISAPFAGLDPACVPENCVASDVIAKALVKAVEKGLEAATDRNKEPLDEAAFEQTVVDAIHAARVKCAAYVESRIATTLCVAYFDRWESKLLTFTLGDSKCIVIRRGALVYQSTCTVREFNVPCVVNLAHPLESNDYLVESFVLAHGDICATFTDGIGDNLYKNDLLSGFEALENDASTLQQICDGLVAQCAAPIPTRAPNSSTDATEQGSQAPVHPHNASDEPESKTDSSSETETCPTVALRERLDSTSMEDNTADNASATNAPTPPVKESTSVVAPPHERSQQREKKRFRPFATAAAYEYRRRVLLERSSATPELLADKTFQRHIRDSALLLDLHDGKSVVDRQVLVANANRRPHYTLVQLHRMAQIRALKPDDVTLLVTRFGA